MSERNNNNTMQDKYGPWVVIVGASHGVGAEFARQLAAGGLNCVLLARREAALQSLQAELEEQFSIQTRIVTVDLGTEAAVATISDAIADLEVGLVVYNAGAQPIASEFLQAPIDGWRQLVRLNVSTVMELCYSLGQPMVERGRGGLLLVGSQAGLGGNKKYSMYTGTKGFMLNFGESLWLEWKDKGVDVLNLLISVVDSPTLRAQMKLSNMPGWDLDDIGVPKPVDVARIALRELANGPTFHHPQDEDTTVHPSAGEQRKAAMLDRWAQTAPFVGEG
jgi:short-subunit dehydrogenase